MGKLLNIGFGNFVNADKITAIITSESAPSKRQVQQAKEQQRLIDATQGRKTKSLLFTTDQKLILSALTTDTLSTRFMQSLNLPEEESN